MYVLDEEKQIVGGTWEGYLDHEKVNNGSIMIYTGPKMTGQRLTGYSITNDGQKTKLRISGLSGMIYITYETSAIIVPVIPVESPPQFNDDGSKADKLYVDAELAKKADKSNTFTKKEITDRLAQAVGQKGEKGDQGPQGEIGPPGPKGEQGPQGIQGIKGDKGDIGPKGNGGYTPIKGLDYFDGAKGETGERGPQGLKGDIGLQGLQGIQGERGPQGLKGDTGSIGPKGDKGEKGNPFVYSDFTAVQLEGLRGPQGLQGLKGAKGEKGDTGEQGPPGEAVADSVEWAKILNKPTDLETTNGSQAKVDTHANLKTNPHAVTKAQVGLGNVLNYGIATKVEAETGTSKLKYMTPLRTKEAIDKSLSNGFTWGQLKGGG